MSDRTQRVKKAYERPIELLGGLQLCRTLPASLKPNEPEFWKWSWQEMAKYDIPAIVDAVLEKSGKKNLYYIGHSQGTLIMFTHLAEIRVSK